MYKRQNKYITTEVQGHHPISDNALTVLAERYLAKDKSGKVCESPTGLFKRVAAHIAYIEDSMEYPLGRIDDREIETRGDLFNLFYDMIASRKFLPNTPALVNAGRAGFTGTMHACYVLPIEDNFESIYGTLGTAAKIFKGGGGVGYNFSSLRPAGFNISTSNGVSSGPVSFMRLYDASCQAISQGGIRRGAQMAILDVRHPDIMDFIRCKNEEGLITNFNISVGITDDFMSAVDIDDTFDLEFPVGTNNVVNTVRARDIWDAIIDGGYKNGEPGAIFIDTINSNNPLSERIICTNPCGEQPLLANEPCVLGSIDLAKFVVQTNGASGPSFDIDWDGLKFTAKLATRFLDNMIDASNYATDDIRNKAMSTRRVGLGVMGFAHALYKMGCPYTSGGAEQYANDFMHFINKAAVEESHNMAFDRGAYPAKPGLNRRNVAVTTIAPTGTISMLADLSLIHI